MKKLAVLLLLFFTSISFAQITTVTTSGQNDSAIFDLNSASPAAGIPVIFTFTVPTTFDGDSITIYTYPRATPKSSFFASTFDGESLRMKVVPGETVALPPYKFFWVQRYVYFHSNDPASGNDTFNVYPGNYREK